MDQTLHQHVESFLSQLVQAWRAVQLYPAGNPRIREAVAAAVLSAQATSEAQARETTAPTAPDLGKEVDFTIIRVTRDAFMFDDAPVAPQRQGVCRLAEELYGYGVKFLWLRPGLCASELEGLLSATAAAESTAHFEKALQTTGFDHIGIEIIEDFQLVDHSGGEVPSMDMLGYLRNKQARRRAPLDEADPLSTDLTDDEAEDLSDLAEFFLEIAHGSEEKTQYLYNNLSDPRRLAETLTYLARIRSASEDSAVMPVDAIRQTLGHISDTIKQLPAHVRERMARNIAEAVLTAGQDVRAQVVDSAFAAEAGRNSIVAEVCASLPDEVVSHLLTAHIRLHQGTANSISNFLDDFAEDEQRRGTIKKLVLQQLRRGSEGCEHNVLSLLEGEPTSLPPQAKKQAPDTRTERETVDAQRESRARELTLAEQEFAGLIEAVGQVTPESDLERAVLNLLGLRIAGHISHLDASGWTVIHQALERAVDHGRFAFIAKALGSAGVLAVRTKDNDAAAIVESFTPRLVDRKYLPRIIRALLNCEHDDGDYRALLELLSQIGERAYEMLFDMLAKEQDRARRRRLILAFLDLGTETVYFLSRMIEHRQWYVVRNVAYLLGRLGLSSGISALERVLYHPDIRVRREVLRAAASIRGPEAEGLLRRCLDDDEPVIRGLAAEWLGIISAKGILEEFRNVLANNDRRLRSCHEFAAGLIRALGRIGDTSDVPAIERLKHQSTALYLIRHSDVADACDMALGEIWRRHETAAAAGNQEVPPL